jgi:hypothetical protein
MPGRAYQTLRFRCTKERQRYSVSEEPNTEFVPKLDKIEQIVDETPSPRIFFEHLELLLNFRNSEFVLPLDNLKSLE